MTDDSSVTPVTVEVGDEPIGPVRQFVGPVAFIEPKPVFTFHGGGAEVARLASVDGQWRFSLADGVAADDAARAMLEALNSTLPRAETHGIPADVLRQLADSLRKAKIDPAGVEFAGIMTRLLELETACAALLAAPIVVVPESDDVHPDAADAAWDAFVEALTP